MHNSVCIDSIVNINKRYILIRSMILGDNKMPGSNLVIYPLHGKSLLVAVTLLQFLGCASSSVSHDFDSSINFSQYKTFGWMYEKQPQSNGTQLVDDLMNNRIRSAIDTQMINKGISLVALDKADLLLSYQVTLKQKLSNQGMSGSIGIGRSTGSSGVGLSLGFPLTSRDYKENTLIIDISDAKTKTLIWRGYGVRRVDPKATPAENIQEINDIVAEILNAYPPAPN